MTQLHFQQPFIYRVATGRRVRLWVITAPSTLAVKLLSPATAAAYVTFDRNIADYLLLIATVLFHI